MLLLLLLLKKATARSKTNPSPTNHLFLRSRTGKKGPYAAYYLHLEPGNKSFIGGGLWQPDGPSLDCIRTEIDQNPQDLKNVLMNKNFRRDYFPALKGKATEKDAVTAFCEKNKEGALKTKPRVSFPSSRSKGQMMRGVC